MVHKSFPSGIFGKYQVELYGFNSFEHKIIFIKSFSDKNKILMLIIKYADPDWVYS